MTDLNALADRLERYIDEVRPSDRLYDKGLDLLHDLRQHAGSGWIKTSERLPEDETDVWIPCREGVMEASFVDNGFCYWDEDEREWIALDTPDWWTPRIVPTPPHTD